MEAIPRRFIVLYLFLLYSAAEDVLTPPIAEVEMQL